MNIEVLSGSRTKTGSKESKRIRRTGMVPGVVYGGGQTSDLIAINHNELKKQIRHEAFHASVLTINIDGKKQSAILRDLQMHPVRDDILHIDFQRVQADEEITMEVPLHFINVEECPGVKVAKGFMSHVLTVIEVTCLPSHLPEYIEVDVGHMNVGDAIHLSQLKLPEGVSSHWSEDNDPVVSAIAFAADDSDNEENVGADGEGGNATENN